MRRVILIGAATLVVAAPGTAAREPVRTFSDQKVVPASTRAGRCATWIWAL
jgi:hypothetical protein